MNYSEILAWTLTVVFTAFFALLSLAFNEKARLIRLDAIERGYALYCPTTGEWAWKGECE